MLSGMNNSFVQEWVSTKKATNNCRLYELWTRSDNGNDTSQLSRYLVVLMAFKEKVYMPNYLNEDLDDALQPIIEKFSLSQGAAPNIDFRCILSLRQYVRIVKTSYGLNKGVLVL